MGRGWAGAIWSCSVGPQCTQLEHVALTTLESTATGLGYHVKYGARFVSGRF
jgi:hypothetical protein